MKLKIKNLERGITLVEILVVIFIITVFSSILVTNFPKIRLQFALTRAVYKMSQDLRRVQDMGFSGQQIEGINVKGYGMYVNLDSPSLGNKKYIIYADIDDDQKYVSGIDSIIETIDLNESESGVVIDRIEGTTSSSQVDINFKPPNPTITITSLLSGNRAQIIFTLESDSSKERIVSVNTSGLIEIK